MRSDYIFFFMLKVCKTYYCHTTARKNTQTNSIPPSWDPLYTSAIFPSLFLWIFGKVNLSPFKKRGGGGCTMLGYPSKEITCGCYYIVL